MYDWVLDPFLHFLRESQGVEYQDGCSVADVLLRFGFAMENDGVLQARQMLATQDSARDQRIGIGQFPACHQLPERTKRSRHAL